MKTIIASLALLLAAPAAAQTAPVADPHAGHAQHQQQGQHEHGKMDHSAHMNCCKDGKQDCCEKDRKADCCKENAAAAGDKKAAGETHEGHAH
jgi:hypothetical protein